MGETKMTLKYAELAGEYYRVYEHYAHLLRTWLVAYGIGGPVILLTRPEIWMKNISPGYAKFVGVLFLVGVVLQVLLALINKTVAWICYYGGTKETCKPKWWYKCAYRVSEMFLIDFIVDLLTIVLFSIATIVFLVRIFTTTSS